MVRKMESSWRKRDTGITIRIIICLGILAFLYIVFITVLAYFGLGFFPIVMISAVLPVSKAIMPINMFTSKALAGV